MADLTSNCALCGIEYVMETTHYLSIPLYHKCPRCGYNPQVLEEIVFDALKSLEIYFRFDVMEQPCHQPYRELEVSGNNFETVAAAIVQRARQYAGRFNNEKPRDILAIVEKFRGREFQELERRIRFILEPKVSLRVTDHGILIESGKAASAIMDCLLMK